MRIFKTKWFRRFARQHAIDDAVLREAISRAERGLIDAELGGGVIKQRVARKGSGRSGGYRTLIVYRQGDLSVFVFGFAKSALDNIDDNQLQVLRELAELYFAFDDAAFQAACSGGELWAIAGRDESDANET